LFQGTATSAYNPVQPPTGSQGPIISQVGAIPGHGIPQVAAPGPTPMGFRPVHAGVAQRPGIGLMQPPSPTQSAPVQPAVAPAAPPPTVQTVDTSNVPGNCQNKIALLLK
jgi:protein transport protein SEC31